MRTGLILTLAATALLVTLLSGVAHAARPSKGARKMRIAVVCDSSNPVLAHTAGDVKQLLQSTGQADIVTRDADLTLKIVIDRSVPPTAFRAKSDSASRTVTLSGADASCASGAAYTALERVGFCFDVTGPTSRDKLRMDRLAGWSETIVPAVKHRGIRQHINFPMDISGYPLAEARDYIRNLARMRMNHISFHSYPGQWYAAQPSRPAAGETAAFAGGFFYNRTHTIPDMPAFKAVRNRKVFCIPEIEPVYDQPDKKSAAAIRWLQEVMKEAKLAGMHVQLSFEPIGKPVDEAVAIAEALVAQYPMIDTLELVTQEVGGVWDGNAARPVDEVKKQLVTLFGEDSIKDPDVVSPLADGLWQLPGTLREFAASVNAVAELRKRWAGKQRPTLAAGVYCTEHGSLRVVAALMRRYLPADVERVALSAHGGRAVVDSIRQMGLTAADLKHMMLYSWTEFDGSMFLQQNSVTSTRQMMDLLKTLSPGSQPDGLAFNHWRTAENRTSCRYAALATIYGDLSPERFYQDYGTSLGIGRLDVYAKAMQTLDDADELVRCTLGNIGFCFEPCWHSATAIGVAGLWGRGSIENARARFQGVREQLAECLAQTKRAQGRAYLEFLINRLDCTIIHLQAVSRLCDMRTLCPDGDGSKLDANKRAEVEKLFEDAFALIGRYMDLHAKAIADRGCEGTLVSYHDTLWGFASWLRSKVLGTGDAAAPRAGDHAPPPPAIQDK